MCTPTVSSHVAVNHKLITSKFKIYPPRSCCSFIPRNITSSHSLSTALSQILTTWRPTCSYLDIDSLLNACGTLRMQSQIPTRILCGSSKCKSRGSTLCDKTRNSGSCDQPALMQIILICFTWDIRLLSLLFISSFVSWKGQNWWTVLKEYAQLWPVFLPVIAPQLMSMSVRV